MCNLPRHKYKTRDSSHVLLYLGRGKKVFLSLPLMFLFNTSSHYGVNEALVGDKSEIEWNKVWGILLLQLLKYMVIDILKE